MLSGLINILTVRHIYIHAAYTNFPVCRLQIWQSSPLIHFLLLGGLSHTISLLASSFVEEEHQTWYFFSLTAFIIITARVSLAWLRHLFEDSHLKESSYDSFKRQYDVVTESHYDERLSNQRESVPKLQAAKRETCVDYAEFATGEDIETVTRETEVTRGEDVEPGSGFHVARLCVMLILTRVARSWNRTGDKWAHLPDVGDWLIR